MTLKETAMILAYLREFYPNGKDITQTTVNAWHSVLEPYGLELVKACARNVAMTYQGVTMPPVSVLIAEIKNTNGENDTAIELWRIAERWIRRGTSMTQADFDGLPDTLKAYFGSVASFKELALQDMSELPNERARFLRYAPQIAEREASKAMLPQGVTLQLFGEVSG